LGQVFTWMYGLEPSSRVVVLAHIEVAEHVAEVVKSDEEGVVVLRIAMSQFLLQLATPQRTLIRPKYVSYVMCHMYRRR
jgi:hypothetical protein